jgi:hypothetical protein
MLSNSHYKQSLLNAIAREWDALWSVIDRLSPEQMTTPDAGGWSPKDNLAHLAEWMKVLMGYHIDKRLPHEVMDVPEEITKDWDFNVINPVLFERNKNRTTEDVLKELKKVHDELIVRLEAMSIEELMQPRRADDPQKRPLVLWILGDTSEHFAEHRATIQKALK